MHRGQSLSPPLGKWIGVIACTGLALVAGCQGGSSTSQTAATTAPTAAVSSPAPTSAVSAVAAPSPSPLASPSVSPAAVIAASASPSAAAGTNPGATLLTILPDASEARYRAREQLAALSAPSDAVGTTRNVSGTILVNGDGTIAADRSHITVDLSTLRSDRAQRDNYIKSNTLQTNQFPNAVFVVRDAAGLPRPLPSSGDATFQLTGDLTVHDVARPATWDTSAHFASDQVSGTTSTTVTLADFNLPKPQVAAVLSIQESITLEMDFQATRQNVP